MVSLNIKKKCVLPEKVITLMLNHNLFLIKCFKKGVPQIIRSKQQEQNTKEQRNKQNENKQVSS